MRRNTGGVIAMRVGVLSNIVTLRSVGLVAVVFFLVARPAVASKQGSAFYPPELVANARANAGRDAWVTGLRDQAVKAAQPWLKRSDDALWHLMFGNTIKRSWMVWSNGHCPSCRKSVPMYTWEMNALERPWKTRCPHCKEVFPKNDFHAFYRSGLDEHDVFDPKRADRRLLFNAEHPDAADPLRGFGVDDGEGYVEGANRWRFIGAYLIYGQWKQAIVGGISRLAEAYVLTGDKRYAHKTAVMLDRVADLYPTFDFGKEGVMYEGPPSAGYVSTWHDACVEVRDLAMAYDQIYDALQDDGELVEFLSAKARQHRLDRPKMSIADIGRNIEERILQDTLKNRPKIESNYPQTDMAIVYIRTILDWPANRDEVLGLIDKMIETATAVDGVSGEKGLAGYSTIAPRSMAELLARYTRIDPGFLREMHRRHPRIRDLYRFHIDTWCLQNQYYPQSGDTGAFARKCEHYAGASFTQSPGMDPSLFRFMWDLYELTGDVDFVRVLYHANGGQTKGLPYDPLAADPAGFQRQVGEVIGQSGAAMKVPSVNKQEWCLAILRSGEGANERAVWLDYDAGGRHSHADGMSLGLFAKGLDLMPDFGYPPVQYGGWGSPRARWYTMTAAHNTVVVDGKNQGGARGCTTLWADGKCFRIIRASEPKLIGGERYERTVAVVDISERDFYVVDVFHVVGGNDHAKFVHSGCGRIAPVGLKLEATPEFGHNTQMRNFQTDTAPQPGWSVDWQIDDLYKYVPSDAAVHVRYTDLTPGIEASVCEGWIAVGLFDTTEEVWIPRLMVRRRAETAPLASTFVGVIEPYEKQPQVARIRRSTLQTPGGGSLGDAHVAIEVELADGRRDLLILPDPESASAQAPAHAGVDAVSLPDRSLRMEGRACWIRHAANGAMERLALVQARSLATERVEVKLAEPTPFVEIEFTPSGPKVVTGDAGALQGISVK